MTKTPEQQAEWRGIVGLLQRDLALAEAVVEAARKATVGGCTDCGVTNEAAMAALVDAIAAYDAAGPGEAHTSSKERDDADQPSQVKPTPDPDGGAGNG